MGIGVIAHRGDRREPEDFASCPDVEPARVMKLYAEERSRIYYGRSDDNGAALVMEAENEEGAKTILGGLPLAKLGMLSSIYTGPIPVELSSRDR